MSVEQNRKKKMSPADREALERAREKLSEAIEMAEWREKTLETTSGVVISLDVARALASALGASPAPEPEITRLRGELEACEQHVKILERQREGVRPISGEPDDSTEACDYCDGCGWVEGGVALKCTCPRCDGTGVARLRSQHPERAGRAMTAEWSIEEWVEKGGSQYWVVSAPKETCPTCNQTIAPQRTLGPLAKDEADRVLAALVASEQPK